MEIDTKDARGPAFQCLLEIAEASVHVGALPLRQCFAKWHDTEDRPVIISANWDLIPQRAWAEYPDEFIKQWACNENVPDMNSMEDFRANNGRLFIFYNEERYIPIVILAKSEEDQAKDVPVTLHCRVQINFDDYKSLGNDG